MEIFRNLKKLLHMVGLYSLEEPVWYKWFGLFGSFWMIIFLVPSAFFLASKDASTLNNIEKYASVIPVWVGVGNGTFKGWFFLFYRSEVKSLLTNIQECVSRRGYLCHSVIVGMLLGYIKFPEISMGRPEKHYISANSASNFRVNGFRTVMGICGVTSLLGPTVYVLFHYFHGTLTSDKVKTPIPALLPYELTNVPAYAATYIVYGIAIYLWVFSIAAIDSYFMSFCLVFSGCFRDLIDMFGDTDELLDKFSENNLETNDRKRRFIAMEDNLKYCVNYHNIVYSLIEQFQQVIGPVVFAQYFFSLFQLGTLVFAILMVSCDGREEMLTTNIPGASPDLLFFNINLITACLTELIIYCYFGSELTYAAKAVSNGIYSCKWYEYHPKLRRYVQLSMIRAQKMTHIHGFYMIISSLETFMLLINLIASAFTLLKSAVNK